MPAGAFLNLKIAFLSSNVPTGAFLNLKIAFLSSNSLYSKHTVQWAHCTVSTLYSEHTVQWVTAQKCYFQVQKKPCGHVTAQKCYFGGTGKTLRACCCSEMLFLRYEKAPAGMLLLRNTIIEVQQSPWRHVTAQKCYFWGTKTPLRACHCSEMPCFRYKKAPAGMLLLRNAIFQVQKSPCGHVTAQKCNFLGKNGISEQWHARRGFFVPKKLHFWAVTCPQGLFVQKKCISEQ